MSNLVPEASRIDRAALERIIRRAAEIQAGERDIGEGLTEGELMTLGQDVGIPDRYLRQALLEERTEILQIAEHFKARAVDYGTESMVLQAYGSSEKLDALISLLRPFSIAELVRSGKLLMARGKSTT